MLTAMVVTIGLGARQTTFTVDTEEDLIDGDLKDGTCPVGSCSLRAAIMQANVMGVSVTIIVPALPAGETYRLIRPVLGANGPSEGDLNLTTPLTPPTDANPQLINIVGTDANTTIIESNGAGRVLSVASTRRAAISDVTIRGGVLQGGGEGGGIYNAGTLTLNQVTVRNNQATNGYGAGIYNVGGLTVIRSTLNANQGAVGGAIYNAGGTVSVTDSTISGNVVGGAGGGIVNGANLTLIRSTLYQNGAHSGGGIFNGGNLIVINSTLSQNYANTDGGGIYNFSEVNMYNSSVMFNGANEDADQDGNGGGIWNNATFNIRNTLVAGNYVSNSPTADECYGSLAIYSRNIIGVNAFPAFCNMTGPIGSNRYNLNSLALIGPLQDNGGPTWTHALLSGSNAIDGAEFGMTCIDSASNPLQTDQRGAPRQVDGDNNGVARCDIGPFELQPPPTITAHPQSQPIAPGNTAALSVTATTAPLSYQWYVGTSGTTTSPIGGATSSDYTTPALTSTTSYWVRVSNVDSSADSNTATITVTSGFTDDPLIAGASVIRTVHITQLRARIDTQRTRFGLSTFGWTTPSLAAGTTVRAVHVSELRTALQQAYSMAGQPAPTFTDSPPVPQTMVIKMIHISELRTAVLTLETS